MKFVIPGGTGQVGQILTRAFRDRGHRVVVLGRANTNSEQIVVWDGRTLGAWANEIDDADVIINLAGRSVNCRYTKNNLKQMMDSRVNSTLAVGQAIQQATCPPRVWLQASTATIYAHSFTASNDEKTGIIGGQEQDAPAYWKLSIDIAQAWEKAQEMSNTPHTRKVALRSAMIMSPDKGGIFDTLLRLTRLGLGGTITGGKQFVSWIHERDFVRAIEFLIEREDIHGPVNISAPTPVPQKEFMAVLRRAWGTPLGLPATKWMVEAGAFFMRTDTELILKSRRVVPGRLLDTGFTFEFSEWAEAAKDLIEQVKPVTSQK